jgi:hypothetical protein
VRIRDGHTAVVDMHVIVIAGEARRTDSHFIVVAGEAR